MEFPVIETPSGIRVAVVAATPDPERLVWLAQHQDVTDHMTIEDRVPSDPGAAIVKTLLQRGHYGPFEHPTITFNIGGVSRSLMAQLTRHRIGISFDVQSLRYTRLDEIGDSDEDLEAAFAFPPYLAQDEPVRVVERRRSPWKIENPQAVRAQLTDAYRQVLKLYRQLLEAGLPAADRRALPPPGPRHQPVVRGTTRAAMPHRHTSPPP
ncbi:MAG: FAD-dependent thymidylate synthase, partial [Bacillota bacterium]